MMVIDWETIEVNGKPVQIELEKVYGGGVILCANRRYVLLIKPDGSIYRYKLDERSGFPVGPDGRVQIANP